MESRLSDRVRELVLAGVDGVPPVIEALEPSFAVVATAGRRVRRSWLDSFDWRLFRAGLTLEQRRGPGATELILSTTAGQPVARWAGAVKTPSRLTGWSDSPVGSRIAPILGVRALLEVADATVAVHQLRLLNGDDKTIARVTVEVADAAGPERSRISVVPLRGYEGPAKRAGRLIAAIPGTGPADRSALDSALAARGRWTGDYSGKIDVRLEASAAPTAAVASVLLSLVAAVEANVDGVIADIDSEFLHDLRVAVRRIRSTLKLLGDVLPAEVSGSLAEQFKWLGDLTTPVRDLDVYLLDIVGQVEAASDLAPLHRLLEQQRRTERRALLAGLRSARFAAMRTQWRTELGELAGSTRADGPARTVNQLARVRVRDAHRRLLKRGAAITEASPPEALHDLRKRGKELRTVLEVFASLYDPRAVTAVSRELKTLQDCLGDFQDREVQSAGMVAYAEQLAGAVPVTALLAMGALAERLDVDKRAARARFAEVFGRFSRPGNTRAIRALTGDRG